MCCSIDKCSFLGQYKESDAPIYFISMSRYKSQRHEQRQATVSRQNLGMEST